MSTLPIVLILKMYHLTESQRGEIIGLYKDKQSLLKISKLLKIHRTTVSRTIKNYLNRNNLITLSKSGRPKLLASKDKKILKKITEKNNKKSAEQIRNKFIEKTNIEVSTKTIRRNLHEMNIFSRIPAQKPLLNDQQRENRLKWCIERKNWTIQKWKTIIWSDESRFTIFKNDGPGRVWRTPGTRFNIENMVPTVKFGGGGLMVWGCFSGKGLGPLVKTNGNLNRLDYIQILEEHLLPLVINNFNCKRYLFQDDNAPIHTAKDVKQWILENKIKILPNWPSQSPDLNPIEHLWSELERRIRNRLQIIKNIRELEIALQDEWGKISKNQLRNYIESMPRRIEAVIENNGWPTKY
jgi:transposase